MIKVHYFECSGEAYDATQCREEIAKGDILVIESEKVVGIADTWPFAVTMANGKLHSVAEGSVASYAAERNVAASMPIAEAYAKAIEGEG